MDGTIDASTAVLSIAAIVRALRQQPHVAPTAPTDLLCNTIEAGAPIVLLCYCT